MLAASSVTEAAPRSYTTASVRRSDTLATLSPCRRGRQGVQRTPRCPPPRCPPPRCPASVPPPDRRPLLRERPRPLPGVGAVHPALLPGVPRGERLLQRQRRGRLRRLLDRPHGER